MTAYGIIVVLALIAAVAVFSVSFAICAIACKALDEIRKRGGDEIPEDLEISLKRALPAAIGTGTFLASFALSALIHWRL